MRKGARKICDAIIRSGNGVGIGHRRAAIFFFLASAIVISRSALQTKWLFYFDNVNFALALRHFDPRMHQPQPPGYPLFVALMHLIHLIVPGVNDVEMTAGLIGSLLTLALIWRLTSEMFGKAAAPWASLLLVCYPTFWTAGIGNPVRTFLCAGACVVGLCVWRVWTHNNSERWLYLGAISLGLFSGFRPELLVLMAPLLAAGIVVAGPTVVRISATTGLLLVSAATWLVVLVFKCGGISGTYELFTSYLVVRSHYSAAFGGQAKAAYRHFLLTLEWLFLPTIAWVWALPFARKRIAQEPSAAATLLFCLI